MYKFNQCFTLTESFCCHMDFPSICMTTNWYNTNKRKSENCLWPIFRAFLYISYICILIGLKVLCLWFIQRLSKLIAIVVEEEIYFWFATTYIASKSWHIFMNSLSIEIRDNQIMLIIHKITKLPLTHINGIVKHWNSLITM